VKAAFVCALMCCAVVPATGCGTTQAREGTGPGSWHGPVLQIKGVEIYNGLAYPVKDVVILVPASGEFVSCGNILPESSCSTSFPARDYRETPVQVSWTELGKPHNTPEFTLAAPAAARDGEIAYIRVEVFAAGQAGARLVSLPPQPD
jgi:hypothetical protein